MLSFNLSADWKAPLAYWTNSSTQSKPNSRTHKWWIHTFCARWGLYCIYTGAVRRAAQFSFCSLIYFIFLLLSTSYTLFAPFTLWIEWNGTMTVRFYICMNVSYTRKPSCEFLGKSKRAWVLFRRIFCGSSFCYISTFVAAICESFFNWVSKQNIGSTMLTICPLNWRTHRWKIVYRRNTRGFNFLRCYKKNKCIHWQTERIGDSFVELALDCFVSFVHMRRASIDDWHWLHSTNSLTGYNIAYCCLITKETFLSVLNLIDPMLQRPLGSPNKTYMFALASI